MGTGCGDSSQTGIVPQVMNALFSKIETLKDHIEFQINVSFIEVLSKTAELSLFLFLIGFVT